MKKICGKKHQQLSKDEMNVANGDTWRITSIENSVTPDRKQLPTSTVKQKWRETFLDSGKGVDIKSTIKKFVFLIVFIVLIVACKKNDNPEIILTKSQQNNSYEYLGMIHNQFLTNIDKNFEPDFNVAKLDDAIGFIDKFNTSFALTLDIKDEEELKTFITFLNEYRMFVCTDVFFKDFFENGKCIAHIKEAFALKVIDNFEFDKLNILAQATFDNYNGKVSNFEIEKIILNIRDEWEVQRSKLGFEYGQILGITLSISLASIEWWKENHTEKAPPIVGADVAGAVIGAVSAGVGGYITTGSVNWKGVAWGAGVGAVTASTGIVGKVGKWIAKLF